MEYDNIVRQRVAPRLASRHRFAPDCSSNVQTTYGRSCWDSDRCGHEPRAVERLPPNNAARAQTTSLEPLRLHARNFRPRSSLNERESPATRRSGGACQRIESLALRA